MTAALSIPPQGLTDGVIVLRAPVAEDVDEIALAFRDPELREAGNLPDFDRDQMLAEIEVTSDSGLLGMYVRQFLESVHVSVLGIQRSDGELIVGPRHEVRLEQGDRLMVLGAEDEISKTWAARGAVLR